jgi:hypothetical protein
LGGLETDRLAAFAARWLGTAPEHVELNVRALRGGLQAAAVARVAACACDDAGRVRRTSFVVKRLNGFDAREAAVYANILEPSQIDLGPRYLGSEQVSADVAYLYLEYVRASIVWPWRDGAFSALVLSQLANAHQALPPTSAAEVLGWDYDSDLQASAQATLDTFERVTADESLAELRPAHGALRRTTTALADIRQTVLHADPFGATVLHGDVHSGNVMIRRDHAVLLDWGRARVGSALEDVSSWLQSLGYWEPEARRRHDTLLRHCLGARGFSTVLGRSVRDAYWLAAACNLLAGALRYHLFVADACGPAPPRKRAEAARAARDHLRVIRRADAVWRA